MILGLEAGLRKSAATLRMGISCACVLGLGVLAVGFLSGCKNFWGAPTGSTEIALTNAGNIAVTAPASGTSVITVTPANSWTGTVTLTCAVTDSISSDVSPVGCSLSPTSVSITSSTAGTTTLTATTTSTTTAGAYTVTVTGTTSDGTTATTPVCVAVGSGTCTSTASTSGFFYILNSTSISGYSISSGTLNTLANTTYKLTGATAMAMSPSGNFLYVASPTGITLYTIDTTTGALGQGSEAVFDDPVAQAIQVDPSGKWLLDASAAGTLNAYPISPDGAQDASRTTQPVGMSGGAGAVVPGGIAISPTLIAVALGSTGTQVFPFSATSASPLGTGPTHAPYGGSSSGAAIAVAIDPKNLLLYVGEIGAFPNSTTNSGALRAFTIGSSGTATEFTYTQPYAPAGTGPRAILPDSTGSYVYAASWQTGAVGTITGYSVTTSALTALSSTTSTGTEPYGLAEDSTDSFVLAVSTSGPAFDAYGFSASASGQLGTPLTGTPVSTPIAIVAEPAVP